MEITHIHIHNPKVLQERMGFIQLRNHFNELGNLEREETLLELTLPPFDPDDETYQLFIELQLTEINEDNLRIFSFPFLVQAIEYYIVPCLREFIKKRFFGPSPTPTAKSVLWILEHQILFEPQIFDSYLHYAAKSCDTTYDNLRHSYVVPNWLKNYTILKGHLVHTIRDYKSRTQFNFKKKCIQCAETTTFDGRALLNLSPLRCQQYWKCSKCITILDWPTKKLTVKL
jgi:hypothetical protein